LNKEINKKIDEIIKDIETSPQYLKYLSLKEQIDNNKELMELINKVRVMQKDVLHKMEDKEKLDNLVNELENHPLYREYNNTIFEINNIYGIIESNLNNYFNKIIN
jgi:cell fate (sporulation/competence/biofilm development) regulator YmcA (YheA/YmcA/DUF963 family)